MRVKNKSWRRLDNSAQIFPIISNKKFSTVFRISTVLNEKVSEDILKKALKKVLNNFECFKVRLKKGFFWYYLENNNEEPIVEKENNYPCKYINKYTNNGYLFKVTYFENKINLDVFHSLTDGNYAVRFLKEIVYTYLEMVHPDDLKDNIRIQRKVEYTVEDSYIENYNKKLNGKPNTKRAFILKGRNLPFEAISVIHGIIDLKKLKEIVKEKNVTITQYFTALLIYSIYEANYKKYKGKKPIKICIPVDLRKYFNSKTISNFFSYITVEKKMDKDDSFENILKFVKEDFARKLTEEEIIKTMSSNVKLGTNILIKMMPLFIKKFTVKISYFEIRKYTTATLSNIGKIGIISEYKKYIDNFLFLIAPEVVEKIKCSVCSFENNVVFTFTSILEDQSIQNKFFEFLKEQKIAVRIESNGV